jgi:hypothetical protein
MSAYESEKRIKQMLLTAFTSTAEDVAVDKVQAIVLLDERKHVLLLADNSGKADILQNISSQHLLQTTVVSGVEPWSYQPSHQP